MSETEDSPEPPEPESSATPPAKPSIEDLQREKILAETRRIIAETEMIRNPPEKPPWYKQYQIWLAIAGMVGGSIAALLNLPGVGEAIGGVLKAAITSTECQSDEDCGDGSVCKEHSCIELKKPAELPAKADSPPRPLSNTNTAKASNDSQPSLKPGSNPHLAFPARHICFSGIAPSAAVVYHLQIDEDGLFTGATYYWDYERLLPIETILDYNFTSNLDEERAAVLERTIEYVSRSKVSGRFFVPEKSAYFEFSDGTVTVGQSAEVTISPEPDGLKFSFEDRDVPSQGMIAAIFFPDFCNKDSDPP